MLCLFLFHIDYTIYANHVLIKTTTSHKRYRTHYNIYRVIWIPSVLTVFSLRTFSCEVKVVQSCINNE